MVSLYRSHTNKLQLLSESRYVLRTQKIFHLIEISVECIKYSNSSAIKKSHLSPDQISIYENKSLFPMTPGISNRSPFASLNVFGFIHFTESMCIIYYQIANFCGIYLLLSKTLSPLRREGLDQS